MFSYYRGDFRNGEEVFLSVYSYERTKQPALRCNEADRSRVYT